MSSVRYQGACLKSPFDPATTVETMQLTDRNFRVG